MKKLITVLLTSVMLTSCSLKPKSYTNIALDHFKKQDYVNAEKYFRLAANSGDSLGIIGLGNLALLKKDLAKAEQLYLQAYHRGNAFGAYALSQLYFYKVEPKNCKQGLNYLIASAWAGESTAIDELRNSFGTVTSNVDYRYWGNAAVLHNYNRNSNAAMAKIINNSNFSKAEKERQYRNYLAHNDKVIADLLQKCENMQFNF